MNADLERDLGAWARGELARERLLASYGAAATGSVALHERLAGAVAAVRVPDVDAGWAALLVKLDAPSPVVPLRRHARHGRTIALLVAATLVLAGVAFAALWRSNHRVAPVAPSASISSYATTHAGSETVGGNDRSLVPPPNPGSPAGPRPTGPGSDAGSGTHDGTTGDGTSGPSTTDNPHDRDRGTGNDGSHDDHGKGNDGPSGSLPHGSHGKGH